MKPHTDERNIMGYVSIPKLVMKISLPLMLAMLVQALYNIVDSIFVAMLSETALTAVSLAFPLQNLLIAFAIGTAVGVNSYLARKLGEEDRESAEKTAGNGLFLVLCTWLVFVLVGFFVTERFLALFTDDPELLRQATIYSKIVVIASFGIFADIMIERIMQGTGDSIHPMITQLIGAVTNIVLDPIFIFVFDMGVAGAAIATVLGQVFSMIFAIYFVRKNKFVKVRIRKIKPDWKIIKAIYSVGVPTIITNSIGTIMTSLMNSILIAFTPTAVSVFGVYFKLNSLIFMPIFGLTNGMIPIIAYNYGAKNRHRMVSTIKFGATIAVALMTLGTIIFKFFPEALLGLFSASEEMLSIGVPALKIISNHFIIAAFSIALMTSFQAPGIGFASMIVSISRQLVVLIPSAYILGRVGGLHSVWYSFLFAEIASVTLCIIFFRWVYVHKIKTLDVKNV